MSKVVLPKSVRKELTNLAKIIRSNIPRNIFKIYNLNESPVK